MAKIPGPITLTKAVLAETTHGELVSFFNWYLRSDIKAQILFLNRFSDRIPINEAEKYEWLFYKSIQLLRGSAAHLGISKQKTLLRIFDELWQQAADALAVNHYLKTYYICSQGLSFARLLASKEKSLHKNFSHVFNKYLGLLHQLHHSDLPRDLLQRLMAFVDKEEKLAKQIEQDDAVSYRRLKLRLAYYHDGIQSLMESIETEWGNKVLKTAEQVSKFYYTLFTEPWIESESKYIKKIKLPNQVWKIILQRLRKQQEFDRIEFLFKRFKLSDRLEKKKYLKKKSK